MKRIKLFYGVLELGSVLKPGTPSYEYVRVQACNILLQVEFTSVVYVFSQPSPIMTLYHTIIMLQGKIFSK